MAEVGRKTRRKVGYKTCKNWKKVSLFFLVVGRASAISSDYRLGGDGGTPSFAPVDWGVAGRFFRNGVDDIFLFELIWHGRGYGICIRSSAPCSDKQKVGLASPSSPISLAIPVTNATTFSATALAAFLLGEEMRLSPSLLSTLLIVLGVWIALKKSLSCKSEPSDDHDPKAKK